MKKLNSWILRTLVQPIRRTNTRLTGYVIDELELQSQTNIVKFNALRSEVARLNKDIVALTDSNTDLQDEVRELIDSMMDNRNETSLRTAGILSQDDNGDFGMDDVEMRFDSIDEVMDNFHEAMASIPDTIDDRLEEYDFEQDVRSEMDNILDDLVISFR